MMMMIIIMINAARPDYTDNDGSSYDNDSDSNYNATDNDTTDHDTNDYGGDNGNGNEPIYNANDNDTADNDYNHDNSNDTNNFRCSGCAAGLRKGCAHFGCPHFGLGNFAYTANLHTKIMDFGGFDSSRILIQKGGVLMSIGYFPEVLSQGILIGIIRILVGSLGV